MFNMKDVNIALTPSGTEKINDLLGSFNFDDIVNDICQGSFSLDESGIINKIISLFLYFILIILFVAIFSRKLLNSFIILNDIHIHKLYGC